MRELRAIPHPQRVQSITPSLHPHLLKVHSLLKNENSLFQNITIFSLLLHTIPLTSTAAQRDSLFMFLAQFLCLQTLLANWEVSTPEAPSFPKHSPWDQQGRPWTTHSPTGQLKQFLTHKNNVPELFDVFLASFKALQQLGTRWEARTVGQDPKSIEGIGAFPWIGFGSGFAPARLPPMHSSELLP